MHALSLALLLGAAAPALELAPVAGRPSLLASGVPEVPAALADRLDR